MSEGEKKRREKISKTLKAKYASGERKSVHYRHTEEHKRKISWLHKKNGVGKWMLGRKMLEEIKKKMSTSHLRRWRGIPRLGKRYKHQNNNRNYKNWREKVFERDGYMCQGCKQFGGYLQAHHIKGWTEYPELRYEINNGQTLCGNCHNFTKKSNMEMALCLVIK